MVCTQVDFDFGKVQATDKPLHEFVVKNTGNADLQIENISPGCGACVEVIDYTKTPIAPGKSGTITLALLPEYLSGPVSKEALVKTNDPKQPNLILTLKANVIRPEASKSEAGETTAADSTDVSPEVTQTP